MIISLKDYVNDFFGWHFFIGWISIRKKSQTWQSSFDKGNRVSQNLESSRIYLKENFHVERLVNEMDHWLKIVYAV